MDQTTQAVRRSYETRKYFDHGHWSVMPTLCLGMSNIFWCAKDSEEISIQAGVQFQNQGVRIVVLRSTNMHTRIDLFALDPSFPWYNEK